MKTYLLLICSILIVGCTHCSKTVHHFDGKTKGFNPYGDGNYTLDRESYWGNQECINRIMDNGT